MESSQQGNNIELRPVVPKELVAHIDINDATWVRVRQRDCLYRPLIQYTSRHAQHSYEVDQTVKQGKKKGKKGKSLTVSGMFAEDEQMHTQLRAGVGLHQVSWEGDIIFVCLQRVGAPVGTYEEVLFLEEFVCFVKGQRKQQILHNFLEHVWKEAQKNEDEDSFRIYTWVIQEQWWKCSSVRQKRPMESVVLPDETKGAILNDLDKFLDEKTSDWYGKHGISYKRSYLLYGPPGTGKTSFLSAVASKYDLNLCFLQAGHPMLTDSSLHDALNSAPADSILVLEDVDALFATDRKSESKSPLTFSGILNALDGLASPHGQMFFLTTNHPEKLDPAMLRHGRVDVRAEFPHASEAQVCEMFKSFYPESKVEEAAEFTQQLKAEWGTMNLAALQDFFIQNREKESAEACKNVEAWLEQQKQSKKAIADFENKNKLDKAENSDENEDAANDDDVSVAPVVAEKSVSVSSSSSNQKMRTDNSALALPAFVLGLVASAAIVYLAQNTAKH